MADDLTNKSKSFWERPEGTTGMIAMALGAVGLWVALPTLLAFMTGLVALLGQTIAAICLALVLGAILFLVTNTRVRTLVSYMFKSAMRAVTGVFVEIDPIGIMKSYIDDLRKKRETMLGAREKLNGQITILKKKIKDNEAGYDQAMAMAKQAHDKGIQSAFSVQSRQAGRLQKLNQESFGPLLVQMEVHKRALDKYYEVTGTVIDDLKNEVDAQQTQREMMLSSYGAMRAAKSILLGGTDQRELFDQALEFVVNDYGMKMGEIDNFIDSSRGFVDSLDMQNGMYEENALKKLQEWEQRADSVLLGTGGKQQMLEQATNTSSVNLGIGIPATSAVDYSKLIK